MHRAECIELLVQGTSERRLRRWAEGVYGAGQGADHRVDLGLRGLCGEGEAQAADGVRHAEAHRQEDVRGLPGRRPAGGAGAGGDARLVERGDELVAADAAEADVDVVRQTLRRGGR